MIKQRQMGAILLLAGLAAGFLLARVMPGGGARDLLTMLAIFVLGIAASAAILVLGIWLGAGDRVRIGTGSVLPTLPTERESAPDGGVLQPSSKEPGVAPVKPKVPGFGAGISLLPSNRTLRLQNIGRYESVAVTLKWRSAWTPSLELPTWNQRILTHLDFATALLIIGILLLTFAAQYSFRPASDQSIPTFPILLFGVAVAGLLVVLLRLGWEPLQKLTQAATESQTWRRLSTERWRLSVVVVAGLVALAGVGLINGRSSHSSFTDVFLLWVISCLLYLAAFFPVPFRVDLRGWLRANWVDVVVAIALTALALAMRVYLIDRVPDIISGDEGQVGLDALRTITGDMGNMFATIWGRGTLYLMLVGHGLALFPNPLVGLRLTSIISGTLTIPSLYVLARRMFDRRVAIVAAGILMALHVHVHFSRNVVTGGIQDALFTTIVVWLMYEALRRGTTLPFVLTGLVMGIYLPIYMGGRAVILFIIAFLVVLAIVRWKMVRPNLANILVMFGALAVSAAPMAVWAIGMPEEFNSRFNQVGIFATGWLEQTAAQQGVAQWQEFLQVVRDSFLTINYFPVTEYYFTTYSLLDRFTAALFLIGLAYALLHVLDERYLLLNAWFWASVVSGAITIGINNFSYRILIVAPVLCLLAAIGVSKLLELAERALRYPRALGYAAAVVVLLASVGLNVRAYWLDWVPTCTYQDPATRFASKLGQYLWTAPSNSQIYLFGAPFVSYGVHPSLIYMSHSIPVQNVDTPVTNFNTLQADPTTPLIFAFSPPRAGELDRVEHAFPGGTRIDIPDCSGPVVVYRVGAK